MTVKPSSRRRTSQGIVVGLALFVVMGVAIAAVIVRHDDVSPVIRTVALPTGFSYLIPDTRTSRTFVGQDDGDVRVFDTRTGSLLRMIAAAPPPNPARIVNIDGATQLDRIVVLTAPASGSTPFIGYLALLDARSGRVLSVTPVTMGGTVGNVAVDARTRRVFVLGFPNYLPPGAATNPIADAIRLTVLDAMNGRVVRTLALAPPHLIANNAYPYYATVPIAVDARRGHVYISAFDRAGVYDVDPSSGRIVRTMILPTSTPVTALPLEGAGLVEDDRLGRLFVIGGTRNAATLTTIDTARWRVLRNISVAPYPIPIVDTVATRVFVVDGATGGINLVDAASGRLLYPLLGLAIQSIEPDERNGRVMVTNPRQGTVSILDGPTGRVLHTAIVAPQPMGVAFDAGTNRLFVTSIGRGAPTGRGGRAP